MPVSDTKQDDSYDAGSKELDNKDKDKDRSAKGKSSTKTKDLSHVPCKFFRVGSCTAGSSCPFSHHMLEPGQQKETCAWFVKGNCKFGHKCALAHVLPGQSMSMDRKNKKAAQAAANAANGGIAANKEKDGRGGAKGGRNGQRSEQKDGSRNILLSGSTAPTRTSRGPIPPMKSTLSPSAPAPPVKDTDFASFGLPDEASKLASPPAQSNHLTEATREQTSNEKEYDSKHNAEKPATVLPESNEASQTSSSPLPASTPAARRSHINSPSTADFGPIGSPSRVSAAAVNRVNGFSPGTSPHHLSTSPFSAPGTQPSFLIREQLDTGDDLKARSGLSTSLGNGRSWSWMSDKKPSHREGLGIAGSSLTNDILVEDDLEEFVPGSLSDLLTPEERSRRFSRTASANRPQMTPGQEPVGRHNLAAAGATTGDNQGHRYSRSVPGQSLFNEIKSIWTDSNTIIPGSPDTHGAGTSLNGGGLGNGTPNSFQSASGFNSRIDEMLAPTNASAAFLPGLQHHYLKSKTGGGLAGNSPYSHTPSGSGAATPSGTAFSTGLGGMALSPARNSAFPSGLQSRPYGEAVGSSETYLSSARHLSNLGRTAVGPDSIDRLNHLHHDRQSALSPSAIALQSHAPGQSLPQGLAAGYSRIHALPPPVIPSPGASSVAFSPGRSLTTGGGFSPGARTLGHSSALSGEWKSMSPGTNLLTEQLSMQQQQVLNVNVTSTTTTTGSGLGGLDTMFSKLSYSAAASRPPSGAPPGIVSRNPSGRGPNLQSPLSRPVLTGDDDDVFSMDG